MGLRGPPPKPKVLKLLQGTLAKHPERQAEALEMPPGAPEMPRGLPKTAREVWTQVVPELLELGTLASVDRGVLEGYCRMFARAAALDDAAAKDPLVETPYGPKVNPGGVEARKLWPIVEKFATDLGLHYAARNRVTMPQKPNANPTKKFLFGPRGSAPPPPRAQVVDRDPGAEPDA